MSLIDHPQSAREASEATVRALRAAAEPLPSPADADEFGAFFDRFGDARGVIYRPESELASHYFQAVMAEQFDAWVWFEETSAVTPLGQEHPRGAPELFPFGL